ncbi:carbon-nitrogen hydrolase family protein [Fodinicola feengrottensis]|uniref:Carbon-nitrogen hydrolase family protein n=1 Tax=Fodinicola feengrottensis TaxID=435914 RepID=A0ABN2I394_9ACTN
MKASSLVIAVAQPALVSYDVSANAQTQAAVVRRAGARVVVFPELSLTGYELDAPLVSPDDPRLAPIIQACVAAGALALVGAPLAGPCIGMLAVDSSDATVVYRKINLGAAEAERFVPAQNPAVLAVDGWRLGLAICKDTGHPEHAADTAALGIDAYVGGLVENAADVIESRARRIVADHRVWVAFASCAGSTGGGFSKTAGRSSIRTPEGVVVAQAGAEPGAAVRATLT